MTDGMLNELKRKREILRCRKNDLETLKKFTDSDSISFINSSRDIQNFLVKTHDHVGGYAYRSPEMEILLKNMHKMALEALEAEVNRLQSEWDSITVYGLADPNKE